MEYSEILCVWAILRHLDVSLFSFYAFRDPHTTIALQIFPALFKYLDSVVRVD